MKNGLIDANNYLFECLEDIANADNEEELNRAIKKGKAVSDITSNIIGVHQTAIQAQKVLFEYSGEKAPVNSLLIEDKK